MSKRITRVMSREWGRMIAKSHHPKMEIKAKVVQCEVERIVRARLHPSVTLACKLYPTQIGIRKSVTIKCISDIIGEEEYFGNSKYVYKDGSREIWTTISFPIPLYCVIIAICKGEFEDLWEKKVKWVDDAIEYQQECFEIADEIYKLGTLKRCKEAYPEHKELFHF